MEDDGALIYSGLLNLRHASRVDESLKVRRKEARRREEAKEGRSAYSKGRAYSALTRSTT